MKRLWWSHVSGQLWSHTLLPINDLVNKISQDCLEQVSFSDAHLELFEGHCIMNVYNKHIVHFVYKVFTLCLHVVSKSASQLCSWYMQVNIYYPPRSIEQCYITLLVLFIFCGLSKHTISQAAVSCFSPQNRVQGVQRCEASEDDPGQVPVPAAGWKDELRDQLQRNLQGPVPAAACWQQGPGEEEDTQFVQWALHRPHQTGESTPAIHCTKDLNKCSDRNETCDVVKFLPRSSHCTSQFCKKAVTEAFQLRNLFSAIHRP